MVVVFAVVDPVAEVGEGVRRGGSAAVVGAEGVGVREDLEEAPPVLRVNIATGMTTEVRVPTAGRGTLEGPLRDLVRDEAAVWAAGERLLGRAAWRATVGPAGVAAATAVAALLGLDRVRRAAAAAVRRDGTAALQGPTPADLNAMLEPVLPALAARVAAELEQSPEQGEGVTATLAAGMAALWRYWAVYAEALGPDAVPSRAGPGVALAASREAVGSGAALLASPGRRATTRGVSGRRASRKTARGREMAAALASALAELV